MSSVAKLGPPIAALMVAAGFQRFADEIPNGHRVPNPYPQGGVWGGVGHFKVGGGGQLNPFGEDFRKSGFEWTEELCQTDSDGDGRSNGVELGDPDCEWSKGGPDPSQPSLSHPGIVDEPKEEAVQSSCSDYQEPEEAIQFDIKFAEPAYIDASRTHYVCQQMEMPVPKAAKLHKIKSRVLLDNANILHHVFVFVCWNGYSLNDGNRVGEAPYACDGAESTCTQVGNWAIGPHEECLPPTIGDEFDFTGLENVVVKIEAHYDNTLGTPQQDQSGIQITFTPDLRPLTVGLTTWGMDVINKDFAIPPQQESYAVQSICPTEATAKLDHPIYLFQFYPHMHLHGRTMFTEHYRCGQKIGELGRIEPYEFDNQQQFRLDPIKILPGDALVTTCEFNTMDLFNETLTAGLGTNDEMCVSIMSFYPRLEQDGLLRACFSFENGLALDRVNLGAGGMDPAAGGGPPPDSAAMASMMNGRWALASSNPLEGVLTDFSSDPTSSWAPCCETNSCDTAFLAAKGEACAFNSDCADGLACEGGLCGGVGASEEEKATEGENHQASSTTYLLGRGMWAAAAAGLVLSMLHS